MRVIHDVSREPPCKGDLFSGCVFWIAQRVPDRSSLVKLVTYNDGTIVPVESRANYLIVDPTRDGLPSGAISYRFILDSVDKVELDDVETHRCGPRAGAAKDTGSARPARRGRLPFTAQDDKDLYLHVRHCERNGAKVRGNEVYIQHENLYPRHSHHSYRDRFIKVLSLKRPAGIPVPTPSPEPHPRSESTPKPNGKLPATFALQKSSNSGPRLTRLSFGGSQSGGSTPPINKQCPDLPAMVDQFQLQDFHDLSGAGKGFDFMQAVGRYDEGWDAFAQKHSSHSADQWKAFWENCVKPVYQEFGDDKKKLQIYDEAFDRWEKKFGPDAGVRNWVDHFRREVAPKLREQSTAQDQEAAPSSPARKHKEPLVNGHSKDLGTDEYATSPAHSAQVQNGSVGLDGNVSSPMRNSRGKRGREDDSDAENETPPSKKIRTNDHTGEDESIHDSIEFSPTKKLASSPLGERKVIQVGTERSLLSSSSSSSSDLFVSNRSKVKAAAVQDLFEEEEEEKVQEHEDGVQAGAQAHDEARDNQVDESEEGEQHEAQDQGEDQEHQVEEQVRRVLGVLDEQQVHELLEFLRTAPSAPLEHVDMTPFDATFMHTIHVLTKGDPSVEEWYQFNAGFCKKVQKLGIYDELFPEGEPDDEEEQANQNENLEDALNNVETNGLVEQEPTPARDLPTPRDPTLQSPSPSQPNPSANTPTFTDSYTHTDDDSFDDPIDLDSGDAAEAYITARLNPPWAFAEDEIVAALHATCACSTRSADRVLAWMRQNCSANSKGKARRGRRSSILPTGKFLPVSVGVWTDEDDKAVKGETDAEEVQRIERKHGLERCRQRKIFLSSMDE